MVGQASSLSFGFRLSALGCGRSPRYAVSKGMSSSSPAGGMGVAVARRVGANVTIMLADVEKRNLAIEIIHRRFYAGRPKRIAALEEARANAEVARRIYELRTKTVSCILPSGYAYFTFWLCDASVSISAGRKSRASSSMRQTKP
jgi:hypothetical protein